jgi:hypothetical protein
VGADVGKKMKASFHSQKAANGWQRKQHAKG